MAKTSMTTSSVRVPTELWEESAQIATELGMSLNAYLSAALREKNDRDLLYLKIRATRKVGKKNSELVAV